MGGEFYVETALRVLKLPSNGVSDVQKSKISCGSMPPDPLERVQSGYQLNSICNFASEITDSISIYNMTLCK